MNLPQLLDRIETRWHAFQDSYADLSDALMMTPGVSDTWSIKDLIAHVTIWEEEALKYLPVLMEGGKPPRYSDTYGGIDAFNDQMIQQWRALPLAEVRRRHEATHARLIAFVRAVPEAQYIRETPFRSRLRLDTYSHYPIHAKSIIEWRNAQSLNAPSLL
jgi:hypothetical protein